VIWSRVSRSICLRQSRKIAHESDVRTVYPPQDRIDLQGVRSSASRRLCEVPPVGEDPAQHQRAAVIALIDYQAGNLTSVKKALAAIGAEVFVPAQAGDLASARGVFVPGVGP